MSKPASTQPSSADNSPPQRKLHGLSPLELQQRQLEKLMSNVEKPVFIPEPRKEKTMKAPKDFIRNVQGSSAGAGSGEFHVYRQVRRREYSRLKDMEDKAERLKESDDFSRKMDAIRTSEEEKTAKKRAKRQNRKAKTAAKTAQSKEEAAKSKSVDERATTTISDSAKQSEEDAADGEEGVADEESEDVEKRKEDDEGADKQVSEKDEGAAAEEDGDEPETSDAKRRKTKS